MQTYIMVSDSSNATNIAISFLTVLIVIFCIIYLTQYLWNFVMPNLFGFKQISFYEALALLVLATILFK